MPERGLHMRVAHEGRELYLRRELYTRELHMRELHMREFTTYFKPPGVSNGKSKNSRQKPSQSY